MADSTQNLIYKILAQYVGADQAAKAAADIEKIKGNVQATTPAAADLGKELDKTGGKTSKTVKTDFALAGRLRRREYHHSGFSTWRAGGVLIAFNASVKSLFSGMLVAAENRFLNYRNFNPQIYA